MTPKPSGPIGLAFQELIFGDVVLEPIEDVIGSKFLFIGSNGFEGPPTQSEDNQARALDDILDKWSKSICDRCNRLHPHCLCHHVDRDGIVH